MSGFNYLELILAFIFGNITWYLQSEFRKHILRYNVKKLFENDINALLKELDKRKIKIQTLYNGNDSIRITVVPLNKKIFNDNLSKLSLLNYKIYESLLEFYNIMEQVNKGYDFLNKYEDSTQQKEVAENLLKAINNGIKKGQKALQCLNE